ncbi:Gamma-glutamyl-aminobutyraldehyde dehydrogenase [Klebsiella pneumoniae subsp. pneumoniae ST258-K28BO]|nr:Gamma-glutamyl-aminobutyraldehyde dehydrogenase [Klebsiella pneumoniae subsp. pneumoniae ST258-K28BO]
MSVFHSDLFRQQALIAGSWRDAADGTTLAVSNPSTGATLGQIPNMGRAEAQQAVDAAAGPRCRTGARSPPPSAPRY